MPHRLTSRVKKSRAAILRLRLHGSMLIRTLGYEIDVADVWAAVSLGRYEGRAINITDVVEMTGIPRQTVTTHLKWLIRAGLVRAVNSGRKKLLIIPDTALFREDVIAFFDNRGLKILETADTLKTSMFEA